MVVPLTEQITSNNHEEAKPRVSDSSRNGNTLAHSSTGRVISCLRSQMLNKNIQISLRQLLKIVKPELCQEIIKAISNLVVPRGRCRMRRKKQPILVISRLNLNFHPHPRLSPGLALNRLVVKRA